MQSELWNTAVWSSPSAEEDVRARVRKRAKSIRRWHRVPSATALVLVVLFVTQLPSAPSSSVVGVAGEGGAQEDAAPEDDTSSSSTSSSTSTSTSTTTAPDRRLRVTTGGPVPIEVSSGSPPQRVVARTGNVPLVTDPEGDSWDQDTCEHPDFCPDDLRTRSKALQPALDLLSVDVRCAARHAVVRIELLDPEAEPHGDPKDLTYTARFTWDNGDHDSGLGHDDDVPAGLEVAFTRTMATNELQTVATTWAVGNATGRRQPVADVRGRLEGRFLVAEVPFDDWAAAAERASPGGRAPAPGTQFRPPYASSTKDNVRTDEASASDYTTLYRLCD